VVEAKKGGEWLRGLLGLEDLLAGWLGLRRVFECKMGTLKNGSF
jgi:hypothetical protein